MVTKVPSKFPFYGLIFIIAYKKNVLILFSVQVVKSDTSCSHQLFNKIPIVLMITKMIIHNHYSSGRKIEKKTYMRAEKIRQTSSLSTALINA